MGEEGGRVKDRLAADKIHQGSLRNNSHSPLASRERRYVHESAKPVSFEIQSGWKRYKPAVVQDTLLRTALGRFLLLLLVNLWCLRLDLTGTRERSVNCS